jgi:chemotaxis protein histidine kinase CheA
MMDARNMQHMMQYPPQTQHPYSHQPDMVMIPRTYVPQMYTQYPSSGPVPEERPAKAEKKEEPAPAPAAPPAPPPPTAEEIAKQKEADAALQAAELVKVFKKIQMDEEAANAAANVEKKKIQAESDKIAALLAKFEKDRLAREEAAAAKAAADNAAAEAKAAHEKALADAATAARETAEKDAAAAAALAKAESEKAIAEAKAAIEASEAARKTAEEELKKNAPEPDAGKPPIKFVDGVNRSFTLPWHLAKTWKGMQALIKQAFVGMERQALQVTNGHYDLIGPNNEIILPQVWEVVVQPGWEVKMNLWPLPDPIEEKLANAIGGNPHDVPHSAVPTKGGRSHKDNVKVSGSKSAGKRASLGPALVPLPPPPPPAPPSQHPTSFMPVNHLPPTLPSAPSPHQLPPIIVGGGHHDPDDPIIEVYTDDGEGRASRGGSSSGKSKNTANQGKKKQIPPFTKWMLGGARPRPKGTKKHGAAAGNAGDVVKVRQVVI